MLTSTDSTGKVTYYIYGLGLIGQESTDGYKAYHFDRRGSTTAITDINGKVTDRFTYGTYGELLSHTGSTNTPFCYNGEDGVMTDANGLYYMRARYYDPDIKRFVNPDTYKGELSLSVTLNNYAYANGNPVTLTDPFGNSADPKKTKNGKSSWWNSIGKWFQSTFGAGYEATRESSYETSNEGIPGLLNQTNTLTNIVTICRQGNSNKPISVYAINRNNNLTESEAGLLINLSGGATIKVQVGVSGTGVAISGKNGNTTVEGSHTISFADVIPMVSYSASTEVSSSANSSVKNTTSVNVNPLAFCPTASSESANEEAPAR